MSENKTYIEVEEYDSGTIEFDNAFPPLGNTNVQLRHNNLHGRDESDQHIITSITGLKEELDAIKKLKTSLYSRQRNYAQYHLWHDENPQLADGTYEDRTGYFVSLVPNTDHIKICNSADEDVFGVVIADGDAGSIGGKLPVNLDGTEADMSQYGLVLLIGTAKVRCSKDVVAGDCVTQNALGMARKNTTNAKISTAYYQVIDITKDTLYSLSYMPKDGTLKAYMVNDDGETLGTKVIIDTEADGKQVGVNGSTITVVVGDDGYAIGDKICFMYTYESSDGLGYKVTSISDEAGVRYATIGLVPNTSMLARIKENVNSLTARVIAVEGGVTAALNRAEEAYSMAESGTGAGSGNNSGSGDSSGNGGSESGGDGAGDNTSVQEQLDEIEASIAEINDIIKYTTLDIDGSVLEVETIKDKFAPIAEWSDPDSGNVGASYFVDYVDGTKVKIESMENDLGEFNTSVSQNAEALKLLATTAQKYSVGEHSPAYGLTLSEAISILPVGAIYVPYVTDKNDIIEEYALDTVMTFTKGYSYRWTGNGWEQESEEENVICLGEYIHGSAGLRYWFLTSTDDVVNDNIIYEKETLYVWNNFNWVAVASLTENSAVRMASLINQRANSIESSVKDLSGNFTTIQQRVEDNTSRIDEIAASQGDADALAAVHLRASQNVAAIEYMTSYGYEVLDYQDITEAPEGTFYATKPTWNSKTNRWEFSGDAVSFDMATHEYRYAIADNSDSKPSYYEYQCLTENKWRQIKICRAQSIAAIQQQVDKNGASIGMVVDNEGVKAGVIVEAINDDSSIKINANNIEFEGSTFKATIDDELSLKVGKDAIVSSINASREGILISADRINLSGVTTFVRPSDLTNSNSTTVISGDKITTGSIKSSNYSPPNVSGSQFSTHGTLIDLNFGVIRTKTFAVDVNGNAYFAGTLNSPEGNIGGFNISDTSIRNEFVATDGTSQYMTDYKTLNTFTNLSKTDYGTDSEPKNRNYVYLGTDGIGTCCIDTIYLGLPIKSSKTYMAAGRLFSNSGTIGGLTIADGSLYKDKNSLESTTAGMYVGIDGISLGGYNGTNTIDVLLKPSGEIVTRTIDNNANIDSVKICGDTVSASKYSVVNISNRYASVSEFNGYGIKMKYHATDGTGTESSYTGNIGIVQENVIGAGYRTLLTFGIEANAPVSIEGVNEVNITATEGYSHANGAICLSAGDIDLLAGTGGDDGNGGYLSGTWTYSSEAYLKSWRGAKHDIEQLDDRYSVLFDNLNPVRFKYNNGTSDRYHTGFILDELKSAMDVANITTQELAAYCVSDQETGEGGIRYGALIALLVKEVQALKKEIKEIKGNG